MPLLRCDRALLVAMVLMASALDVTAEPPTETPPAPSGPPDTGKPTLALESDATAPVFRAIDITGANARVPVVVTTTEPRTVEIYVFGTAAQIVEGSFRHTRITKLIRPGTPLELQVTAKDGTRMYVVAFDKTAVVFTARDFYGVPPVDAPVEQRAIEAYSPLGHRSYGNTFSDETARLAGSLFTTLDPAYFLYVTKSPRSCELLVGEPVVLFDRGGSVLRANGESKRCDVRYPSLVSDFFSTTPPKTLVLPPIAERRPPDNSNFWKDEEFLALEATNPRIAKYRATKRTASACFDREWAKHDPDSVASRYDVVTSKGGRVTKVEAASGAIQRKVDAACKLNAVERERDAIRAELAKTLEQQQKQQMETISVRLRSTTP